MDLARTQTTQQVLIASASELIVQSRRRAVLDLSSSSPEIDFNAWRELDGAGWTSLTARTVSRIRQQYPDATLPCAVYDLVGLRCPDAPLSTHGDDYFGAIRHAKDYGDAVAIEVGAGGNVEGLYAGPAVTVERLLSIARGAPDDTRRIVAALIEMMAMRRQELRLSQAQTARVREGRNPDGSVYLVYRWQDLRSPIQVYSEAGREYAERRAARYHHLLVGLEPDGRLHGSESGPGPEVSFSEVLEEAQRVAQGEPDADSLAVLGAVLEVWHDEMARELTWKGFEGDVTRSEVPEDELLLEIRRRYAARCEMEGRRGSLSALPGAETGWPSAPAKADC